MQRVHADVEDVKDLGVRQRLRHSRLSKINGLFMCERPRVCKTPTSHARQQRLAADAAGGPRLFGARARAAQGPIHVLLGVEKMACYEAPASSDVRLGMRPQRSRVYLGGP